MLARIRKSLADKDNDKGFTLIELLVVMIIIGILAAIAIPVFLSQRAKARDTAVKADVSTLGKEISTWFVDNTAAPYVGIIGGRYMVGVSSASCTATPASCDVGKVSDVNTMVSNLAAVTPNVAASVVTTTGWTSTTWCAALNNINGSQKIYRYSAQNGLEAGNCTAYNAP